LQAADCVIFARVRIFYRVKKTRVRDQKPNLSDSVWQAAEDLIARRANDRDPSPRTAQ